MKKPEADRAGVIAPPPAIYLVFMMAGGALEFWRPTAMLPWPLGLDVGAALIALAVLIVFVAGAQFWFAKTSPAPWQPSTAIVEKGLYRLSRNPMYVAGAILQLGVACVFGSLWIVASIVPTLVVLHYGVVRREEKYLTRKFGDAYRAYLARVPRWL